MSKKRNFLLKIVENHWIRLLLEIIAFVLLIFKIIPESLVHTGWPFLILVTVVIMAIVSTNYKLSVSFKKQIDENERKLETIKAEIQEKVVILEKKSKYADAIPMLNSAFQELHYTLRKDFEDKTKYHEPFVVFCQNLEKVFNKVTDAECHVSIKMTLFPNGAIPYSTNGSKRFKSLNVKTYCRSSSGQRKQIDQLSIIHRIEENTDFDQIFKGKEPYFFCNDIAKLDSYSNSSLKRYNGSVKYFPTGVSVEERIKSWPLKYRSVITVPIRPLSVETNESHSVIGFLCLDCERPDAFDDAIDKEILIGCSDGIYNSFKKLFSQKQNNHN